MNRIKVLIVDQDVISRHVFGCVLGDLSDIEIVGSAPNGKLGLEKLCQVEPEFVILSTGLSDMNAADFTRSALRDMPQLGILLVSTHNIAEADTAIQALENGALDFILKPETLNRVLSEEEHIATLKRTLVPKIRCFSIKLYSKIAKNISRHTSVAEQAQEGATPALQEQAASVGAARTEFTRKLDNRAFRAVLIGASTGGPDALTQLIPAFPAMFPLPIIIVLHMPKLFTGRMAQALDKKAHLRVKEAAENDVVEPGTVYLAAGDKHLIINTGTRRRLILNTNDGPPEKGCRPAVNVLFRSAAEVLTNAALAVILTGMGEDGTEGLAALKEKDTHVIAQDEESSVVWGMPGSAVKAGYVDEIVSLDRMAQHIIDIVSQR